MPSNESSNKLWGGRFDASTDALVEAFSASLHFDRRLYAQDIRGSIAHATMLAAVGVLSDAERDYYAGAFANTGFTGAINWYRNWTLNWETQAGLDDRVRIPTLFIGAVDDIVIAPEHIEGMKPLVEDLEIHMLEDCGHWSQQEKPDEINRLMIDWLKRRSD